MGEYKKELVFSESRIQARIKELADQISADYNGQDLIVVGVLNGAFMFMSDLVKRMSIPLKIDFVRAASYGSESETSGRVKLRKDVELELTDKHVLIVEDIADSGLTLNFLKKHLAGLGPVSIKICALIDKLERRTDKIEIDYIGFEVESGFLVGYGLDYDEQFRNLPEIYHLYL